MIKKVSPAHSWVAGEHNLVGVFHSGKISTFIIPQKRWMARGANSKQDVYNSFTTISPPQNIFSSVWHTLRTNLNKTKLLKEMR